MKTYIKITLGVVMVIALFGIGMGIRLFRMTDKDMVNAKPDYVISAIDLQKAFEDNESAATAKFVNKILEIEGEVVSVKTVENNALNVTIKSSSDMSSVICTFPSSADQSKFSAGSSITVRGECSGFLMDVLMNNCSLVK